MGSKPARNPGELQSLITEMGRKIKMIEEITGEVVPDMMAKSVLLSVLDPLTRQHTAVIHSQTYVKIRARVLEFASNAMPMVGREARDIGRVESGSTLLGSAWREPTNDGGYLPTDWEEENYGDLSYVGKGGKAKGKGGKGNGECHNCGEKGHFKANCPKPPVKGGKGGNKGGGKGDGKGSGKGSGFQGECYQCGKWGHTKAECWKGKGKGGPAGGGGKGGLRTFGDYYEQAQILSAVRKVETKKIEVKNMFEKLAETESEDDEYRGRDPTMPEPSWEPADSGTERSGRAGPADAPVQRKDPLARPKAGAVPSRRIRAKGQALGLRPGTAPTTAWRRGAAQAKNDGGAGGTLPGSSGGIGG
jgi:hypothetical protein